MFYNTFASRKEDHFFDGEYMNNKVSPNTARHRPLESFNICYDESSRVGLYKTKDNKYSHIVKKVLVGIILNPKMLVSKNGFVVEDGCHVQGRSEF